VHEHGSGRREDSWDHLARALTQDMPRRRALRLFATGVAVTSLPWLFPNRSAAAASTCGTANQTPCDSGTVPCCVDEATGGYRVPVGGRCIDAAREQCCTGPDPAGGTTIWTCDAVLETCGDPGSRLCLCKFATCGGTCCAQNEDCVDGRCEPCPRDRDCDGTCCDAGKVCVSRPNKLCCLATWNVCHGKTKCCPPNDTCCRKIRNGSGSGPEICCGPDQKCDPTTGKCKCKAKGEHACGSECCKKGEHCCGGKRCCPDKKPCCGASCGCPSGMHCVEAPGSAGKMCCPAARIATPNGIPVCCPAGTVLSGDDCCAPGNPGCCGTEPAPVNTKTHRYVCVNGAYQQI
jgi:hypothetical protein